MMPSSTSADKSRQTSAGKSFFGRKLHKERPEIRHHYESGSAGGSGSVYGASGGDENRPPSAARGSPRHTKRSSVQSVDFTDPDNAAGVAPTAGVITSIPFESMPAETRTPIAVDYLSKAEPAQRREPSPHHLAKGLGDFHQYPAWNPEAVKVNNVYSHPTGPRPPPHASNVTMTGSSSGSMGPRYQQWGRPGSSATAAGNNVPLSHNSSSTFDSSANSRFSLDQVSLHSSVSSNTRGSSYFSSSDGSSRTLTTSHSGDRNTLFPSNSSSRLSTATTSTTGPVPAHPENYLSRPRDDRVVDQLFLELMQKRGWQNLPE